MDRLEFLKRLGALTVGASLIGVDVNAMTTEAEEIPEIAASDKIKTKMPEMDAGLSKPVSVIIIGAGGRGGTYAQYAEKFPNSMKVVGVADLNDYRRKRVSEKHNIPAENQFGHYNDLLAKPKFADAVVIATPDNLHYEPCMKATTFCSKSLLLRPRRSAATS